MSFQHPRRPKMGAWLCAEGPYLDLISSMPGISPEIEKPDPKNKNIGSRIGQSRSVMYEMSSNTAWSRTTFTTASEVRSHLKAQPTTDKPYHRIYILEGLDPEFIEAYGSHFLMDPSFFIRQERNETWNSGDLESHINDPCSLPSTVDPTKYFRIKYREVREFGPNLEAWQTTCAMTERHVSAIGFNGKLDTVGLVSRRLSFWSKTSNNGSWDVVFLCDPATKMIHRPCKPPLSIGFHTELIPSEPFQGGYVDFTAYRPNALYQAPPRTSLLDDICHYLECHSPTAISLISPLSAASLPMKILCGHYMKVVDYFEVVLHRLNQTEWQLSRRSDYADYNVPAVEEQWSSIHVTRKRLTMYIGDLQEAIKDITVGASTANAEWESVRIDLRYILQRLEKTKCEVDEAVTSAMGYSNIVGNQQALIEARRSVREAKQSKSLTVLGLIFIPLAYTCGLFSMSDQFMPGKPLFWVYFAVSVPLILLVFLATFFLQLGYDKNGTAWSMQQFTTSFKEKIN